ncbi:MAG: hypothetical protein KAJ42_02960, partial [Gemmatimonadetes bacterium]|nr:hypothetical protein [Gemmatimonadota bacterium]
MFSSPDRSRLFGRGVRFLPVLLSVALASLVVTCTDAPSVPEGMGYGSLQIMPHFSFAGATTTAVEDALAEAFERVNRFRMVIHRLPSNELALDTVLVVSPGQEVYDLQVDVEVQSTNEQFSVVITALEGDTELFTSDPITVTASAGATGSAAAAVAV